MSSVPPQLSGGRLAYERAIRRSSLPAPARHLALTIATWADIESGVIPDRFQPAQSTLEEATGLSRGAVFKHLKVLEDEGWLSRDVGGGRNRRTKYALRIPPGAATDRPRNQSPGDTFPGNQSPGEPQTSHLVDLNQSPRDYKSPSQSREVPLSPPERVVRAAAVVAEDEEREFIAWINNKHQPRGPGWWKTVASNGDLPDLAAAWQADKPRPSPASSLPPWCGHCGDKDPAAQFNKRLRILPGGALCACHPDAPAAA